MVGFESDPGGAVDCLASPALVVDPLAAVAGPAQDPAALPGGELALRVPAVCPCLGSGGGEPTAQRSSSAAADRRPG